MHLVGGHPMTAKARSGFTIVELLIVIVVIAILAAITIVAYNGIQNRANNTVVQSDMKSFGTKLEQYYIDNERAPASVAELNSIGFPFAVGSYQAIIYCTDGQGNFGISGRSTAVQGWYYTHLKGTVSSGSVGGSAAATCTTMGMTTYTFATWGNLTTKSW
jgi:prepilin-type N-terminal cleavage/methylation domain-containing protein